MKRLERDVDLEDAEFTALSVLGGVVVPGGPCDVRGCGLPGARHRNGIWCNKHVRMMEWRGDAHVYVR